MKSVIGGKKINRGVTMRIAIIGCGGVGGYFGGKLAKAGNDVTFFARGEHLKALQANGLTVKSILGDFKIDRVKATDSIKQIGNVDLIIMAVKAWQVKDLALQLRDIVDKDTKIIPLQNGVMAAEEIVETIGAEYVIGGLCRMFSKIESPGVICHFGVEPMIVFGERDGSISARTMKLKTLFDSAAILSKTSDNIQAELWRKFIVICVSALLAVTKCNYGELRELQETRQMMIDLLTEIYTLSQKIGISLEPDIVSKSVGFIDSLPYESTSSLTRDVLEGKPSEIDYQNGTVVKLGEKYGVATPTNKFIYHCILPMEKKARKR
jgi:2-dehydropantoate 2-reductase